MLPARILPTWLQRLLDRIPHVADDRWPHFLEHWGRAAVLLRGHREEPAPEEGPDRLCRTRKTIQPERTMIRSNL
jgi:hypothetical protein